MHLAHCWCGSSSYRTHARFKTNRLKQDKPSYQVEIVTCTQCGTIRMRDNGREGDPDYEASYDYQQISPRHQRTIELVRQYAVGSSLLDIGCSTGVLLAGIQAQIPQLTTLKGIDLDHKATAMGRERYGLDLEALDLAKVRQPYDNLTLAHTLEHVIDLPAFLHALDAILNPGGTITIAVPNMASYGAKTLLPMWPALRADEHVWYFDQHTIRKAFAEILPAYQELHRSSFQIWKPFVMPRFRWNPIQQSPTRTQKWEAQFKGDQLDFVVQKPA